jgi:hypothetical protein
MAQQDAMEQVKEVLRQLIKYRFWIAISAAAVFGVVAYFMGAGPVRLKADEATKKILAAETEVKTYASPTIPTKEWADIVNDKIPVLTRDVNTAWKTLYDRQAPLLTWPDTVQERFRKWGRKWPENEDAGKVTLAQIDYIAAYKDYVDMVYKTFNPFNFETGEGIVAAPAKEMLLRPATFSDEEVPGLTKIWSAQERLWIQRTLLEVVAQVNKNANAKDWNSAIIREIEGLEVGSPIAQDQRSLAKNEQLEEAPKVLAPGETDAPADAGGTGATGGAGMPAIGRGAGPAQDEQSVYYVKSGNDQQYKVIPVQMTVLIDQDHVQDLLVELENSPMSIQVMDFELQRPSARVAKPEKGTMPMGGMGMGGRMGDGGEMGMRMSMSSMPGRGARGMAGMGGMASRMGMQMGAMGRMGSAGPMGSGATSGARKGIDNRTIKRADERKKAEEAISKTKGPSLFDPYFDIVQVTVYGQARFFNPPPEMPAVEPSPGETAAATPEPTATKPDDAEKPAAAATPVAPDAAKAAPAPQEKQAPAPAPADPAAAKGAPTAGAPSPSAAAPPVDEAAPKAAAPAAAKAESAPAAPAKPAAPPADAKEKGAKP